MFGRLKLKLLIFPILTVILFPMNYILKPIPKFLSVPKKAWCANRSNNFKILFAYRLVINLETNNNKYDLHIYDYIQN